MLTRTDGVVMESIIVLLRIASSFTGQLAMRIRFLLGPLRRLLLDLQSGQCHMEERGYMTVLLLEVS